MTNEWNCPTCTTQRHAHGRGCADLRTCSHARTHPNATTAFYLAQLDAETGGEVGIGISEIAENDQNAAPVEAGVSIDDIFKNIVEVAIGIGRASVSADEVMAKLSNENKDDDKPR